MKKKQLFAGALAAAMMTASLAGCGGAASSAATSTTGGDTAGSTASADTNSGVVEVTIPSFKTGENVGAVFFEPQVERFNEKYAGKYKINLESVPQDSIFNDRIKQLAQQNKLPVLVEGGDRLYHANLWWGPFICFWVFWLESVSVFLQQTRTGAVPRWRLAVCAAALAWHIVSGVCFLVMLLQGVSYNVPILTYNLW